MLNKYILKNPIMESDRSLKQLILLIILAFFMQVSFADSVKALKNRECELTWLKDNAEKV